MDVKGEIKTYFSLAHCRLWSWKRKTVSLFAAILESKSGAITGALCQSFSCCEFNVDCVVGLKLQVDEYFLLKNKYYKSTFILNKSDCSISSVITLSHYKDKQINIIKSVDTVFIICMSRQ